MNSRNFIPEQTLLDRLLIDDAAALEELSRRYCYSLYSYCLNKLNSPEDSKRIVRNIFISLWEDRHFLPANFSLSLHLYTQVRKAVIQCINNRLNSESDAEMTGQFFITGFSAEELKKAKLPVTNFQENKKPYAPALVVEKGYKEESVWYKPVAQLRDMTHALRTMLKVG